MADDYLPGETDHGGDDHPGWSRSTWKLIAITAGLAAAGLLVVLLSKGIRGPIDEWNWVGTLGDWVGGVGVLVAVFATIFLANRDRTTESVRHKTEMDLLREQLGLVQEEAVTRAQRELYDPVRRVWGQAQWRSVGPTSRDWVFEVVNGSDEPIYHVHIGHSSDWQQSGVWLPLAEVIPPGGAVSDVSEQLERQINIGDRQPEWEESLAVVIVFVDAAGKIWMREHGGQLRWWQRWPIPGIDDPTRRSAPQPANTLPIADRQTGRLKPPLDP
jgi:hypothetical protein